MRCRWLSFDLRTFAFLLVMGVLVLGTAPAGAWDLSGGQSSHHDDDHGGGGGGNNCDDDHGGSHGGDDHDGHHGDDDHDGHHGDDDHGGHHGDDDDDHGCGHPVKVCHIPPSDPTSFQTLTVDQSTASGHYSHGDMPGSCSDHCDQLCDDGNPCTVDACDSSGRCKSTHPPVNCDDGNRCTVDSCNPATGCMNVPKSCSDGNLCTGDRCDRYTGACVYAAVCCPAGKTCNPGTGTCDAGGGGSCTPNPCQNGGTCIPGGSIGFTCQCVSNGNPGEGLREVLRRLDTLINVEWRLVHFKSATRYLHKNPVDIAATGGTNWQKYLPPGFQRDYFFPELWSEEEKNTWGQSR